MDGYQVNQDAFFLDYATRQAQDAGPLPSGTTGCIAAAIVIFVLLFLIGFFVYHFYRDGR